MNRKHVVISSIISILFFSLGIAIGYSMQKKTSENISFKKIDRRESGFEYINPLLECEYVEELGSIQTKKLELDVKKIVDSNELTTVSLYYRDLRNGPWFGINLDKNFAPQSLLKLPMLFAYYKMAEENPSILEDELVYEGQTITNKNISPAEEITPGAKYKIDYLIYRMISLSDNAAFELLALSMPSDVIRKVHFDLGIPYPEKSSQTDFMNVRSYSSLFRVLYNSSYLTRHYSNLALLKLIDTKYDNGLRAGVPKNVEIAHKFGVKQIENEKKVQLHDCGIIYHKTSPYVLCIMTKGNDIQLQEKIISNISKKVYQDIDSK